MAALALSASGKALLTSDKGLEQEAQCGALVGCGGRWWQRKGMSISIFKDRGTTPL
ncbi:MAG: hypothetical protein ACTH69_12495 [Halomonas sp.]|uniref:hypothetical protein n=1 Tax=Halomonas sp. TaxID=1486246 RepID=UPI003F92F613